MSDSANVAYLLLLLILPISALLARRLPIGATIKMALIWVAIFGTLFLAVMAWQQARGAKPLPDTHLYFT